MLTELETTLIHAPEHALEHSPESTDVYAPSLAAEQTLSLPDEAPSSALTHEASAPAIPPEPAGGHLSRAGAAAVAGRAKVLGRHSRMLLRDPHIETFALLCPTARWRDTLGILAAIGAIGGILYNIERPMVGGVVSALIEGGLGGAAAGLALGLTGAALLSGLAVLFGGSGSPRILAYLLALSCGPLLPLGLITGAIPWVGGIAGAALSLYGFALAVLATSASYRLSYARSAVAVLAGMLLFAAMLLLVLAAFVVVTLKVALTG
jgi:hypothetical protein